MFGKSSLEIHKLILRSTEVDLTAYVGSFAAPNVIIVSASLQEGFGQTSRFREGNQTRF